LTSLGAAGNIVGMTSSFLLCANGQDRDFVIVTAHHDGKFIVWDFDYDAPLKVFSLPNPEKLTCISSSLHTHGEIYGGTETGGIVRFSVDDAQCSICTVASNQVSTKPLVSITLDGNGQILMLNSEGLVFLASLK
jgi:WD40 repeat protein